jgi:endonuclease V
MNSEQTRLAKLVEQTNAHLQFSPASPFEGIKYIAGVDISFVKGTQEACAILVVLKYPELTVAYKTWDIVTMTEEYVPFYLAFREARHLVKLFERMKVEDPEMFPQVVFVDGGGVWHPKGPLPHFCIQGY